MNTIQQRYRCLDLPLAVYREVAAHLQQVEGVTVTLVPTQSTQFNYHQSQIDWLELAYPSSISPTHQARIAEILRYYGNGYGHWTSLPCEPLGSEIQNPKRP